MVFCMRCKQIVDIYIAVCFLYTVNKAEFKDANNTY